MTADIFCSVCSTSFPASVRIATAFLVSCDDPILSYVILCKECGEDLEQIGKLQKEKPHHLICVEQ